MKPQPTRGDLIKAVQIIKQWHDMDASNYGKRSADPLMFKIYYDKSPEMKFIRDVLGSYDEMKDEVIEANSIIVNK